MAIHRKLTTVARRDAVYLGCAVALAAAGCSAFNPAFLNLIAPGGGDAFITLPNPPGFVVLALVNNAQVDESLVNYLNQRLNLTGPQLAELRPRVRMRLRITYSDGTFQTVEVIDGSGNFVDPNFNAQSLPDLNQNDLTNVVARCDVASIALEPGTNIEVFVPVPLIGFQLVEITTGTVVTSEFRPRTQILPQFRALQIDDVDADGNTVLRRNIDVRDVLSPTTNVVCGSVVAVVVDGVLSVPFLRGVPDNDAPSFDQDDAATVASIGGRFEFRVSVQ
ncbi:MAG: hypothetical protein AAB341_03385 [Planctomycetota bacterium]